MTHERLRELLAERVADETPANLASAAWARARAVRRRRTAGLAAGATACVLAVVAVTSFEPQDATRRPSGPAQPMTPSGTGGALPSPTDTPTAERTGRYAGAPVWWAPGADREADLPALALDWLPSPLSLGPTSPAADFTASRVEAVFQVGWQGAGRYVVLHDRLLTTVDLSSQLGRVSDIGGNRISPLSVHSLSPDGTRVFFVQSDGLALWDLTTGEWTTEEMSVTVAERARWTPGGDLWLGDGASGWPDPWTHPGDQPYGVVVTGLDVAAESDFALGPVPTGPTGSYSNPEILIAKGTDGPAILALGLSDGRSKVCCPLVGWSGDDVVLFESHTATPRILAWRVGTGEVYAVAELTDAPRSGFASSYAVPPG